MKRRSVYGLARVFHTSASKRARAIRRRVLRAMKRAARAQQTRQDSAA